MFAIILKENDAVIALTIDGITMPALFVNEADANRILYKNDLDETCLVHQVKTNVFKVTDENT